MRDADLFAYGDRAALKAALDALDASAAAIEQSRAAVRAALGDGEADPATIDLNDRWRWLTIEQAAFLARCSPDTIRRRRAEIGHKINGRWWIDRYKLMSSTAGRA